MNQHFVLTLNTKGPYDIHYLREHLARAAGIAESANGKLKQTSEVKMTIKIVHFIFLQNNSDTKGFFFIFVI